MQTKTDQIRAAWLAGDQISALRIAARFFDRSITTKTFQLGMNAHRQRNLSAICRHFAAVQRGVFASDFPASMTVARRTVHCQAWQAAAITAAPIAAMLP
jgi:hypothetical protein